jgi:hypothetical protein
MIERLLSHDACPNTPSRPQASSNPIRIRDMVRCDVLNGPSVFTRVRGEIQAPLVYAENNFLSLGVCFVGVKVVRTVTLTNASNLEAPFTFDSLQDLHLEPEPVAIISASPSSGILGPKSSYVDAVAVLLVVLVVVSIVARDLWSCLADSISLLLGFLPFPGCFRCSFSLRHRLKSCPRCVLTVPHSVAVSVIFAPKREGKLEALACFDVEGVRAPLGVSVLGEVKGMVFACSVVDPLAPAVATTVSDHTAAGVMVESDAYRYTARLTVLRSVSCGCHRVS